MKEISNYLHAKFGLLFFSYGRFHLIISRQDYQKCSFFKARILKYNDSFYFDFYIYTSSCRQILLCKLYLMAKQKKKKKENSKNLAQKLFLP